MAVTIQVYVKTSAFSFEVKPLNLIIEGKNTIRCNRKIFYEVHYVIMIAITIIVLPDLSIFSPQRKQNNFFYFLIWKNVLFGKGCMLCDDSVDSENQSAASGDLKIQDTIQVNTVCS